MTKVFDEYPQEFKEAYATFEFFRRLGFPPNNLFVHLRPDGVFFVVLQHLGKEFAVSISRSTFTERELYEKFSELARRISSGEVDEEELQEAWQNSFIFNNKLDALMAMAVKGIQPLVDLN